MKKVCIINDKSLSWERGMQNFKRDKAALTNMRKTAKDHDNKSYDVYLESTKSFCAT